MWADKSIMCPEIVQCVVCNVPYGQLEQERSLCKPDHLSVNIRWFVNGDCILSI